MKSKILALFLTAFFGWVSLWYRIGFSWGWHPFLSWLIAFSPAVIVCAAFFPNPQG
jgi:hypothetical protein